MFHCVSRLTGRTTLKSKMIRQSFMRLAGVLLALGYIQISYAADPLQGVKLYQLHCINCHGANGAGEIPNVPDFSRGERLLQPDDTLLETIKSGKGMMPAYRGMFSDDEILDLIAYIRTLRR